MLLDSPVLALQTCKKCVRLLATVCLCAPSVVCGQVPGGLEFVRRRTLTSFLLSSLANACCPDWIFWLKRLPLIGCAIGPNNDDMLNAAISACVPSSIDLAASAHCAKRQDIDVGDDAASVASRISSAVGGKVEQWMIVMKSVVGCKLCGCKCDEPSCPAGPNL